MAELVWKQAREALDVGLGFMTFGDAAVGGYISTVAGFIASGLGVAYNPLRNA